MAAAKKNAKGNKTAHVLNLLTAPGEVPPAGEETTAAETPEQEVVQPAAGRPLLPPILEVAQSNDDNLAQQIQQALEEELQSEEPPAPPAAPVDEAPDTVEETLEPAVSAPVEEAPVPPAPPVEEAPAPAQPPAPQPAPAPSGGKMSQEDIERMLASLGGGEDSDQAPAETPAPVEEAPAEPPAPRPVPEDELSYINIMQALVEEKAPHYIKKFGLCSCKHCEADVKALTLTNLVPKYVVLSKRDRIPMLTVYEGRYSTTIFAQLTRACKVVMDAPRHGNKL